MARFLSIEAESTQIRVGEVEISGRKGRMLQCFCVPVPQGSVEDGQIRDTKGLGELLRQQLNERGIRTKKAWFVTGSTRIASREVQIPLVKKSRIQSIIEANATDYFPIDVTKYVMSYIILGITGEKGKKGEEAEQKKAADQERQYRLMVYASPKAISTAYYEFAQSAGLTLSGITFTGNTVYQTVQEEYTSGAHILIKVELENTGISIIRDGKLSFQRNINYGMESAVETIRSFPQFGDRLEVQDALQLLSEKKWIYPSLDGQIGEEPDTVKSEVTESLRYLVGNISRIMDYYISRNGDVNFESIVLCGMGGQVQGLAELLTQELGQKVELLTKITRYSVPDTNKNEGLFLYIAVMDPVKSGLNLMEKTGRKQKEVKETLSGAWVVFGVGVLAAVALAVAGVGARIYQTHEQERLNQRIAEEQSIEDVYAAYNNAKSQYDNFQSMYAYTNTPNEGLEAFIQEMEEKMPSSITVETFSSTGSQVSFSMRVASKSEAANTLIQLRTFDSLSSVTTTGIDEGEDGTVTMSVTCTYRNPALLDDAE
ncbi:pilus assembly protein PilM [Blautia wexlerae]|uniref:Pilus assembly protein PilM n=1 Tax=Blautia wexlerae TaxID=418240 RepID=A0ABX2GPX1_9FIRM|nr:pilus assembly protein PilM [Blautia wexlerae]NSF73857.1 pilus assembly protein PilM [Blautia wexlerae]